MPPHSPHPPGLEPALVGIGIGNGYFMEWAPLPLSKQRRGEGSYRVTPRTVSEDRKLPLGVFGSGLW